MTRTDNPVISLPVSTCFTCISVPHLASLDMVGSLLGGGSGPP